MSRFRLRRRQQTGCSSAISRTTSEWPTVRPEPLWQHFETLARKGQHTCRTESFMQECGCRIDTACGRRVRPAAKVRTMAEPMNVNGSRGPNPRRWLRTRLGGPEPAKVSEQASPDENEDFAHDHRNDATPKRSECNADSDFARSPHRNIGHDSVEPDDCE